MSWRTIVIADVTDELSPQEVNAFNTIQGQSTSQQNILNDVIAEFRGAILGGGNQLDAPGTIPDQLRNALKDVCLWRFLKKFPQLKALQTDIRKAAYDDAMKLLRDISKRNSDYKIELPAVPQGDDVPIAQIQVTNTVQPRQATRDNLRML